MSNLNHRSIHGRKSKVTLDDLARQPLALPPSFLDWFPNVLASDSLRQIVTAVVEARRRHKPVILCFGAHVIKCGLSPILNTLIARGLVTCVATNGASVIHDLELAMVGHTSEDVGSALLDGTFGTTEETQTFFWDALRYWVGRDATDYCGIGEAMGRHLWGHRMKILHPGVSVFATAERYHVPATVHVGVGTDIVHMSSLADGALLGKGSFRDFYIFTRQLENLHHGGVILNIGSAVIMPEVVLKAIAVWRNKRQAVELQDCPYCEGWVGVNMDMIQHYRPNTRIVEIAKTLGGTGYSLTGHHEIMVPLLGGLILGAWEKRDEKNRGVQDEGRSGGVRPGSGSGQRLVDLCGQDLQAAQGQDVDRGDGR
jgi:hypothetical protein